MREHPHTSRLRSFAGGVASCASCGACRGAAQNVLRDLGESSGAEKRFNKELNLLARAQRELDLARASGWLKLMAGFILGLLVAAVMRA